MKFATTLFKKPKMFWVLALGEFWNTFSYFGMQTLLVLYVMHTFRLTHSESYLLYGAYAALAYSLPIMGGFVADRWIGNKRAVFIGGIINCIGNLLLMIPHYYLFCLGLTISLVGIGLYKSNCLHIIGALYSNDSNKKEQSFTLVYLCINVGGVLGPLFYSVLTYKIGWKAGFLCSAMGILVSLIWLINNWSLLENEHQLKWQSSFKQFSLYIILLIFCLLLSIAFYFASIINVLIFIVFIMSLISLVSIIMRYKNNERHHLLALLIISFFGMFYFAAGLQIGSTITLFIQSRIDQGVINIRLPASIFSTLYPLFVLILAPFFTYLWQHLKTKGISINTLHKLIIGIALAAAGISVFAISALTSLVIPGIILGILLLSAGELALTPAVYTSISDLAPPRMKSTMLGCWFLFIGLGGYLSGILAKISHSFVNHFFTHQASFLGEFLFIASFTFLIVFILFISLPRLSKLIK